MNVKITLESGKTVEYRRGITVAEVFSQEGLLPHQPPVVGAFVNNDTSSLSYRLEVNARISPIKLTSREGANIYRRSLSYLLALAAKKAFPKRRLVIGHSLGRGYFYYFDGMNNIPQDDLKTIETTMKHIVDRNLPINREVIAYQDAVEYFRKNNQQDTLLLLENRNEPKIPIYRCDNYLDISHSPLVPKTGILRVFEIKNYPPGFILRYPPADTPYELSEFKDNQLLFSIYQEYKNWGKILGINCVGALNQLILKGEIKQFIQVAEALHNKKIAEIADRINSKKNKVRIILIAGPSSSGKTTFSKKLAIQLKVLGRNPVTISLDDYFVAREKTPRDKNGNYDFEALEALDIELLNDHLVKLMAGEEVEIPDFDFHLGKRKEHGKPFKLPERGVLIMEGIHGLNDKLTPLIDRERKYKIYVSALTQLNLDDHNRISTTDNRLLRRMVRDYKYRGHSALTTLEMWPSVRKGESRNIFPFQNSADSAFNSALDYELAVLKVYAEPLLRTIKPDKPVFYEAQRLLRFIDNFIPLPSTWVSPESILREFIGNSAFKY